MPSSRELAKALGVSRNLVLEAYAQLAAEGYLERRPRSGMIVAAGLRSVGATTVPVTHTPTTPVVPAEVIDFRPGLPALEQVPRQQWGRLMQAVCRETTPDQWGYGTPEGDAEIREVLCRHLARVRGVDATPEQVVMTTGAAQAFTLLAQCWLRPADLVLVEDPMSADIRRRYTAHDVRFASVSVDAHGLVVEAIPAGCAPPDGPRRGASILRGATRTRFESARDEADPGLWPSETAADYTRDRAPDHIARRSPKHMKARRC